MVTFLTWNIQHGGGARRTPAIALALVESGADVVVLTEFRAGRGGQIRGALADHGLKHQAVTPGGPSENGVLIASRAPLAPGRPATEAASAGAQCAVARRWLEVRIPELIPGVDLRLAGLHVPPAGPGPERAMVWRQVVAGAAAGREEAYALLGDFNTGRAGVDGRAFQHTAQLGRLATMGYVDAWRTLWPGGREVTWRGAAGARRSGGSGRIDHCFLSGALAGRLEGAWIDGSRLRPGDSAADSGGDGAPAGRLSDHAPLVIRVV